MRICRWYFVIYPTSRSNLGNVETWDIFKNENVEEFGIVENKNVVEFGNENLEKVLPALGKRIPVFEDENCLQNCEIWVYIWEILGSKLWRRIPKIGKIVQRKLFCSL